MKNPIGIKLSATVAVLLLGTVAAQAGSKTSYFSGQEIPIDFTPGRTYVSATDSYFFGREFVGREALSDERLAGKGYFEYSGAGDMASGTGVFWGSGRLVPDKGGGEWNGYFVGKVSATGVSMDMTLVGSGKYAGLVARLTYPSWPDISGYIVEAKGATDNRPFQVSARSTERIEILDCLEADPSSQPLEPPVHAQVLKLTILNEVAQGTHLGRSSNEGFAVVDPQTGKLMGTGVVMASNGDLVRWVLLGAIDPTSGLLQGSVYFCSGTGRFDAVVGGFGPEDQRRVAVPGDPSLSVLFYTGSGTIGY